MLFHDIKLKCWKTQCFSMIYNSKGVCFSINKLPWGIFHNSVASSGLEDQWWWGLVSKRCARLESKTSILSHSQVGYKSYLSSETWSCTQLFDHANNSLIFYEALLIRLHLWHGVTPTALPLLRSGTMTYLTKIALYKVVYFLTYQLIWVLETFLDMSGTSWSYSISNC